MAPTKIATVAEGEGKRVLRPRKQAPVRAEADSKPKIVRKRKPAKAAAAEPKKAKKGAAEATKKEATAAAAAKETEKVEEDNSENENGDAATGESTGEDEGIAEVEQPPKKAAGKAAKPKN